MLVVQIQARDACDVARGTSGFETLVGTFGEAERALADLVGPRRAGAAVQALARSRTSSCAARDTRRSAPR